MMRLFAALEIPFRVREELAEWWQTAARALEVHSWRLIPENNWHLTLAFYGDINGQLCDTLSDSLREHLLGCAWPMLHFSCVGVFPRPSRPRTCWIGVEDVDSSGRLKQLARCCRQAGHATLRKRRAREEPFRGHITLARARGYPQAFTPEQWQHMPVVPNVTWTPQHLCLFRSWLRPEGAHYACVEKFHIEGRQYV